MCKSILSIIVLFSFGDFLYGNQEIKKVSLLDLAGQAKQSILQSLDLNDRKRCQEELKSRLKLLKRIISSSEQKLSKNNLKIKETAQLTRQFEKNLKKLLVEKDETLAKTMLEALGSATGLVNKALKQAVEAASEFDYLQIKRNELDKERIKLVTHNKQA